MEEQTKQTIKGFHLYIPEKLLVLVSIAKWKRPVKLVYEIGQKGKGAICAPNRQNEPSPVGSIGLWSGFYFAMDTRGCTKRPEEPIYTDGLCRPVGPFQPEPAGGCCPSWLS